MTCRVWDGLIPMVPNELPSLQISVGGGKRVGMLLVQGTMIEESEKEMSGLGYRV